MYTNIYYESKIDVEEAIDCKNKWSEKSYKKEFFFYLTFSALFLIVKLLLPVRTIIPAHKLFITLHKVLVPLSKLHNRMKSSQSP